MNGLESWWSQLSSTQVSWPAILGICLALGLCGYGLERLLFAAIHKLVQKTATQLDDVLVRRLRPAVRTLVLLGLMHLTLHLRGGEYPRAELAVAVIEWLLVAYLAIEALETLVFDWIMVERRKLAVPDVLRHLVLITLYVAALLTVLGTLANVSLAPILATGSVLTVVLGLALQDTLGNLFAGLTLHADRSIAVGEWVQVDGVEGKVVGASWRTTSLETFTGDVVSFPNSVIAKAHAVNYDRPEKATGRNVEFLVSPGAKPEAVEAACKKALARAPLALADHPRTRFWFVAMHPLYQRWVLRCWAADFAVHDDMESQVLKALWHTLREAGIAMQSEACVPGSDPQEPEAVAVPAAEAKQAAR